MAINTPFITSTQVASSTPFDPTTGDGFIGTDVQSALQELRNYEIYGNDTTATTTNGTLTLLSPIAGGQVDGSTSGTVQFITGTATGFNVKMPNATTLSVGAHYKIDNTSTEPVTIEDGSGALLFVLSQSSVGELTLELNGTAAGTWVWYQIQLNVASGIITYNVTSSTTFSSSASVDTLITGMSVTPQAGAYGVWYSASCVGSGSGQELTTTIYAGAVAVTDSIRNDSSPSGTHIFSTNTQTIHQFDGSTTCNIKINPNGNGFTIGNRSMLLIRFGT